MCVSLSTFSWWIFFFFLITLIKIDGFFFLKKYVFWYYVFLIFHQKVFSFLFIVCLTLYFLLVSFFLSFGEFFSFFLITLIKIDGFFFNMCFGIIYFFNFPSKVFSFLFIAFVEFWFRLMIFFFFL